MWDKYFGVPVVGSADGCDAEYVELREGSAVRGGACSATGKCY